MYLKILAFHKTGTVSKFCNRHFPIWKFKVSIIFHAIFQANIQNGSEETVDFIALAFLVCRRPFILNKTEFLFSFDALLPDQAARKVCKQWL